MQTSRILPASAARPAYMMRYMDVDGSDTAVLIHQLDTVRILKAVRLFIVDSDAGNFYRRANHYIGCAELDGALQSVLISKRCT